MKDNIKESFFVRAIIYFTTSIFILLAFTKLGITYGISEYLENLHGFSDFDVLMNQISNTFIVLSLTSVLSTNVGNIYWVDIKDYKLVKPFFTCFVSLSIYLMSALIYSIIVYGLKCSFALIVSYIFSVICLIILSYKMISVYFGRKILMKKLQWEYRKAVIESRSGSFDLYKYELLKLKEEVEKQEIKILNKKLRYIKKGLDKCKNMDMHNFSYFSVDDDSKKSKKYNEYSTGLCEKTIQSLDQNDLSICYENIELLMYASDWTTIFDLMDDICFKAPLYASDILFELKHKAGMDLELINKIQKYSKSLFHKLAYENTSIQTMQNLMMILADYNTNCHKKSVSKKIIKTLDEIISNYYKKDSELNDLMKTYYLNGEKGKLFEVRDEINKIRLDTKYQINPVLKLLSDDNIDCFYKPVDELYNSFINNNWNQFNYYMDMIEWAREELLVYIKDVSNFIDDPITLRYFNTDQESLIDIIIEKNEKNRLLPQQSINKLKELKTITFKSKYGKLFDAFNL